MDIYQLYKTHNTRKGNIEMNSGTAMKGKPPVIRENQVKKYMREINLRQRKAESSKEGLQSLHEQELETLAVSTSLGA